MNHKILTIILTTLLFSTSLTLNAQANKQLNKGKGETSLVDGNVHFFSEDNYVYVDEGNGKYARYKWAWKDKNESACKNCSVLDSKKLGEGDVKRIKAAYLKQQARKQAQQQQAQQQARKQAQQQQAQQQARKQAQQQQAQQQARKQAQQQQAQQYQIQPLTSTLNCPSKPLLACSPNEANVKATAICAAAMGSCEYVQKDMSTKEHYAADQVCNVLINKMNKQDTGLDSVLITALSTVIDEASSEANKKSDNWFEKGLLGLANFGAKAFVFGQCQSAAVQSCSAEYRKWRNSCQ